MEKSIEERMAAIENAINRVAKMQTCVFRLVQAQHRISTFIGHREWDTTSLKDSTEFAHRYMNYSLTYMFGGMAATGIGFSLLYAYSVAHDFLLRVAVILMLIVSCTSWVLAVRYNRLASRQRKTAESESGREQSLNIREQAATLDNELARVLAEWKELVRDDLPNEPKSAD
jgi:hypothetical protein